MTEQLTIGGGCFWCLEPVFDRLLGVESVVSGYSGGRVANPTYERVCSGATGHAEVIQVTFDPAVISLHDLLKLFFAFHDPTTLNRQGPDLGTQYRSVIFYATAEQERVAREVIDELEREQAFDHPIMTELTPLTVFYPAEAYHQRYYQQHPAQAYCAAMIAPKMAKLRQGYAARLKPDGSERRPV